MTRAEIREKVVQALASVAPEFDVAAIAVDAALRDQVDLDSMDFLRFVIELHRQFGIEVPEADYEKLASLAGAVDYVAAAITPPS
ncbi:MAG: acyl carrier protein [Vicinamibacterales bacterium]